MRPFSIAILLFVALGLVIQAGCARKPAAGSATGSDFDKSKEKESKKSDLAESKTDSEPKAEKSENPKAIPVADGNGIVLHMGRPMGRPMVYQVALTRKQEGGSKFTETNNYYLYVVCNKRQELDGGGSLDLISMVRSYLDRTRHEEFPNKKKIDRMMPMAPEMVDLGPNYQAIGDQRCYAFDTQNNVAYRSEDLVSLKDGSALRGHIVAQDENSLTLETPQGQVSVARASLGGPPMKLSTPHILAYDSMHFFFPILSRHPVEAGSTWSFRVPVILPQGESGTGTNMATYFDLRVKCTLREISGSGDTQTAVIDYQYSGRFDSSLPEYAGRFPPTFLQNNTIIHSADGGGTMRLNLSKGYLLEKTEEAKLAVAVTSFTPQPDNKPPLEHHDETAVTSTFTMKWLPPGTVLRDKRQVPAIE